MDLHYTRATSSPPVCLVSAITFPPMRPQKPSREFRSSRLCAVYANRNSNTLAQPAPRRTPTGPAPNEDTCAVKCGTARFVALRVPRTPQKARLTWQAAVSRAEYSSRLRTKSDSHIVINACGAEAERVGRRASLALVMRWRGQANVVGRHTPVTIGTAIAHTLRMGWRDFAGSLCVLAELRVYKSSDIDVTSSLKAASSIL